MPYDPETRQHICGTCRQPLVRLYPRKGGRRINYCKPACRQKAYRTRNANKRK